MKAQIQFHFWDNYAESIGIYTKTKEEAEKVHDILTKKVPLSYPVASPYGGFRAQIGWQQLVSAKNVYGVAGRYSGDDVKKVHTFLKSKGCEGFVSIAKSIDRGPVFDLNFD
jgi:hypothetical protein